MNRKDFGKNLAVTALGAAFPFLPFPAEAATAAPAHQPLTVQEILGSLAGDKFSLRSKRDWTGVVPLVSIVYHDEKPDGVSDQEWAQDRTHAYFTHIGGI